MKLWFLVKESLRGYKSSRLSFFLTVFTCFISLCVLGIFAYLFLNAHLLVEQIKNRIEIEAFLDDSLSGAQCFDIFKEIKSYKEVKIAKFISQEEAKNRFIDETGIDFRSVLTSNPLPASITIELGDNYKNINVTNKFIRVLKNMDGISDVIFNQELLTSIQNRAYLFQKILLITFLLVTLATVYLISNTIKLNLFNRIDDIKTMRLVGAMPNFIKLPFIFEGIFMGFLGGFFASITIFGIDFGITQLISYTSLLSKKNLLLLCSAITVSGVIFGYFGSRISIRKFFRKTDLFV